MSLINARTLDTSKMPFLVDQMFYTVGSGFVHGPSGAGKSYAFLTRLALDVANGVPFFGHDTVQGPVVVCLGEGLQDAGIRIKAQLAQHAEEDAARIAKVEEDEGPEAAEKFAADLPAYTDHNLVIEDQPFRIPHKDDKPSTDVQRFITSMQGIQPALIIYDALADFSGGTSILNDTTSSRYVDGIKYLIRELDCFVLGIAHDTEKGDKMLGSGRFHNAADVKIAVKPESGDGYVSSVVSEKAKASPKFTSFSYMAVPKIWDEPILDDHGFPTGKTERVETNVVVLQDEAEAGTGFVLPSAAMDVFGAATLPAIRTAAAPEKKRNGVRKVQPMSPEARAARVAELLSVPCHECGAPETVACNPLPGSNFTTPVPGSDVHVSRAAQLAEVKRQKAEMASC